MYFIRKMQQRIILLFLILCIPLSIQAFNFEGVIFTFAPTWIYNGFTKDKDGAAVQGSDVSPLLISFGVGSAFSLLPNHSIEPELWGYVNQYAALKKYDKVVPTQIESGKAVGNIVTTFNFAFLIPWVYTLPIPSDQWQFSVKAGSALIARIPIQGIETKKTSQINKYWNKRFWYPHFGIEARYIIDQAINIGAGIDWLIPIYNAWVSGETIPFFDETMLRIGIRVKWNFLHTLRN